MSKEEIYWKHHGSECIECYAPYEIIEFIYKHESKVLKVDSKNWYRYDIRQKIIDYIKSHWKELLDCRDELVIEV